MKTTVDISDDLALDAKEIAAAENTTLRALIESGLRAVIRAREERSAFRLRDASFRGEGLQPGFRDADWEKLRAAIYDDVGQ